MSLAVELQILDRAVETTQGLDDLAGLTDRNVGVQLAVHDQGGRDHPVDEVQRGQVV